MVDTLGLLISNGWQLEIVKRLQGIFKLLRKSWIVERTFAWLNRNRRLSKDYRWKVQTSETWIQIAMICLMMNRFTISINYSHTLPITLLIQS